VKCGIDHPKKKKIYREVGKIVLNLKQKNSTGNEDNQKRNQLRFKYENFFDPKITSKRKQKKLGLIFSFVD
jgi:hypothetical protein